jgi:AcrR family transcriptional regulator
MFHSDLIDPRDRDGLIERRGDIGRAHCGLSFQAMMQREKSSRRVDRYYQGPERSGLAPRDDLIYELNFMSEMSATTEASISGHTTRRLETRRRLVEAGTELFAEGGLSAVTSTAIASRAGVATGTFYLHFSDKHALFEELVGQALEEMRAQFDPDRSGPGSEEGMRRDVEGMVEVAERRRDLIRAVFDRGGSSGLAHRIQDRIASRLELVYTRVFRECGISLHPGAAAQARAAILVRVIAWWAEDPTRATRDEIVDTLLDLDPRRARARGIPGT